MADVLLGACGFAKSQAPTFRDFDILEVQQSFYRPLQTRNAVRLREPPGERPLRLCGGFRWNAVTRMADRPGIIATVTPMPT